MEKGEFDYTKSKGIAKKFRAEPIEPPPTLLDTRNEFPSHSGFRVGFAHPTPVE